MMQSISMQLYYIIIEGLTLTPICTSRFLLPPYGVDSLSFGHYRLLTGTNETVLEDYDD